MKLTSAMGHDCTPCCEIMGRLLRDEARQRAVDPTTGGVVVELVLRVDCDSFSLRTKPEGGTFEDETVLAACPWCRELIVDCYEGSRWDLGPFALCVYTPDCMACQRGVSIQNLAPQDAKKLLGTNRMQLCGGHHEDFVRNGGKTISPDSIRDLALREQARNNDFVRSPA